MLYNLHLTDDPSVSKQIRADLLQEHLAYIEAHMHLILVGGALLDEDGSTRVGSAFLLNVKDLAEAERFSQNEPYRRAGLYQSISIIRMRRAQWAPGNAPASADG